MTRFTDSVWLVPALALSATLGTLTLSAERHQVSSPGTGRTVALTFDDLPATHGDFALMRDVTGRLLRALSDARRLCSGSSTNPSF